MDELSAPLSEDELSKLHSLPLAYDLSVDSYSAIEKKVEGIDSKIQSILTLSIMVIAVSPALATARRLDFSSRWFVLAVIAAGLVIVLGSFARLHGKLYTIDPKLLEDWLPDSQLEFQRNIVHYAGRDFDRNYSLLFRNWSLSVAVNVLFFIEVVFLVIWAAVAAPG